MCESQSTDSTVAEKIAVIGTVEECNKNRKTKRDYVVVAKAYILDSTQLSIAEKQEHQIKDHHRNHKMNRLYNELFGLHHVIVLHSSHTPFYPPPTCLKAFIFKALREDSMFLLLLVRWYHGFEHFLDIGVFIQTIF